MEPKFKKFERLLASGAPLRHIMRALHIGHAKAKMWQGLVESRAAGEKCRVPDEGGKLLKFIAPDSSHMKIGLISDTHIGSKYCRWDVIQAAYRMFAEEEVAFVLCAGNMVEGMMPRSLHELEIVGLDNQTEAVVKRWPRASAGGREIVTYTIDGDDHEGWWTQNAQVVWGEHMEALARAAGRTDLVFLGYLEADFRIGNTKVRMVHPKGATPQAVSWVPQKMISKYESGEKPHILIVGHHHKFCAGVEREVYYFMAGSTKEQDTFLRGKSVASQVGFSIIDLQFDKNQVVSMASQRVWRFYDRRYYGRVDEPVMEIDPYDLPKAYHRVTKRRKGR